MRVLQPAEVSGGDLALELGHGGVHCEAHPPEDKPGGGRRRRRGGGGVWRRQGWWGCRWRWGDEGGDGAAASGRGGGGGGAGRGEARGARGAEQREQPVLLEPVVQDRQLLRGEGRVALTEALLAHGRVAHRHRAAARQVLCGGADEHRPHAQHRDVRDARVGARRARDAPLARQRHVPARPVAEVTPERPCE